MAKPRKQLPDKSVQIFCKACRAKLYLYKKGGTGKLVKCFLERITKDFTINKGTCPNCSATFGRECMIRGVPAIKIIGGKVLVK